MLSHLVAVLCIVTAATHNHVQSAHLAESPADDNSRRNWIDHHVENCSSVRPFLESNHSVSDVPLAGKALRVCRSEASCCSPETEAALQERVHRDLHNLLHHQSRALQGLLATTAATLHDHVTSLAARSENKTLSVLREVYGGMGELAREPVRALYSGLTGYIGRAVHRPPHAVPSTIPSGDAALLERLLHDFFARLFPLVYHQAVHHLSGGDFAPAYKQCLGRLLPDVRPFGPLPQELGAALARSCEATKVLLEALTLGAEVLNTTDQLMAAAASGGGDSCHEALLRLSYCPRCVGLPPSVKPCNGYCLNVMRGCLTQQRTNELDLPWNNFLMETERLVREVQTNQAMALDHQLRQLTSRISDAIMFASMNGPALEKKVKKACGSPKVVAGAAEAAPTGAAGVVTVTSLAEGHRAGPQEGEEGGRGAERQLAALVDSIAASPQASKGFYANLAEAICSDDSFAETTDTAQCWNGHRVAEYTKALVRPGVDAQKYNPELTWTETNPDPKIGQLSEKLRHMRQVVLSQLSSGPSLESESYVRDEEGSGSGQRPDWDTDQEGGRDWDQEGSGSGDYHAPNFKEAPEITDNDVELGKSGAVVPQTRKKPLSATASAPALQASALVIAAALLSCVRWHH